MVRFATSKRVAFVVLAWLFVSVGAAAQTLTGAFAEGNGTTVSVSRTITPGRGQFMLITASSAVACSTPTGWTADLAQVVFGTQTYCSFFILNATGSESQTSTLNVSAAWTVTSWEASVDFSSMRVSASAESDLITASADPVTVVSGDLVISAIGNEVAFVASTPPAGYTAPIPTGASVNHYGTNTQMMGALAYRVMAGGGSEDPVWTHDQAVFAGVGVHVFVPGGGGGGGGAAPTSLMLMGVGAR